MERARGRAFGHGPRLTAVVPLSLMLTGCPALLGIDNDYSAGNDGALGGVDAASTTDGHRPPDARVAIDATRDGAPRGNDGASHADARGDARLPPGDGGSPPGDASSHDSCTTGCGCPQGQTMCGTTCVDLTNDLGNCGNCGVSCSAASPSTATCTNARCIVTLASSGGYGSGIAVDSTSVYWANEDSVLKIPLGGGNITTLVANAGQSFQIAINSSNLYWTSFLGSLGRVGLDGSNATTLVSNESINPPYFVALDGSNVYWTNQTDNTTGTIQSQALAVPGTTSTLVSGQSLSSGIAVVSGTLYWADEGGAAAASGSVMTSTTTGASQAVFASGQNAYAIAVDSTNVYWTIPNSPAAVVKAPQANSGGGPVTLASGLGEPTGIAVDSEYVYWVDENASNVMKVAIGGGSPVTVANLLGPQFLAVDATSIYCTTSSPSGNVFKITPK